MKTRNSLILVAFTLVLGFGFSSIGQDAIENKKAPAVFYAKLETTEGDIVIEVRREWAPYGADRFYTLVSSGFYDECKFFRVIKDFMAQAGISGDPKTTAKWIKASIKDDAVIKSNKRGSVTFAKQDFPNTRSTQFFINFADNTQLDTRGFAPFGQVVKGLDVVDQIYSEYGDTPRQDLVNERGNEYLNSKFPKLTAIKKASIVDKNF